MSALNKIKLVSKIIKWCSNLFILLAMNSIIYMPKQANQINIKNNNIINCRKVHYGLAPPDAIDALAPVALLPHIGER
ncbi:hypothetical protein ABE51_30410 [Bacillus thuringiensis]|nr:hypothetical protein [Bacillus thuringiensis]